MDLKTFLLARIAEDEERNNPAPDPSGSCDYLHGVHYDPARVLAECAAKRAIVADRERIDRNASDSEWAMGYSDANYSALRALAAVYSDHPDYQSEWA